MAASRGRRGGSFPDLEGALCVREGSSHGGRETPTLPRRGRGALVEWALEGPGGGGGRLVPSSEGSLTRRPAVIGRLPSRGAEGVRLRLAPVFGRWRRREGAGEGHGVVPRSIPMVLEDELSPPPPGFLCREAVRLGCLLVAIGGVVPYPVSQTGHMDNAGFQRSAPGAGYDPGALLPPPPDARGRPSRSSLSAASTARGGSTSGRGLWCRASCSS